MNTVMTMPSSSDNPVKQHPAPDFWRHPVQFLAFGFGSGLVPKAPGTAGTLMAVPIYLLIADWSLLQYSLFIHLLCRLRYLDLWRSQSTIGGS